MHQRAWEGYLRQWREAMRIRVAVRRVAAEVHREQKSGYEGGGDGGGALT